MASITLRQLQIFAHVVTQGSFRRCAEQLEISQVAVSDHVRELEQRLGHALFERRPGGPATLTPAGRRAERHVVKILDEVERLLGDFAAPVSQSGERHLRIGMQAYLLRKLQQTLLDFEGQHERLKITLNMRVYTAAALNEQMQANLLDAGYFFSLDVPLQPESEYAWTEPLQLYVGRTHPLAGQARTALPDLMRANCIQLAPENPLRPLIDESLRRAGLADLKIAMQTDEFGLILSSVHKGLGFVCMFEQTGDGFIDPRSLVPLQLDQPLPSLQVRRAVAPRWRDDEVMDRLLRSLAVLHQQS